jgi:hypothetical protein
VSGHEPARTHHGFLLLPHTHAVYIPMFTLCMEGVDNPLWYPSSCPTTPVPPHAHIFGSATHSGLTTSGALFPFSLHTE